MLSKRNIVILVMAIMLLPFLAFAATSTNFDNGKEHGGPVHYFATTSNYQFQAEVGHPGAGISTSTNYEFLHGSFWEDSELSQLVIQWAVPELRVGATSTNDDAIYYLSFRTPSNLDDTIVYSMPDLATTTVSGTSMTPLPVAVAPGTYDIGIKTHQHITKVLQDVVLVDGMTTVLNFTQPDNSSTYGTTTLLGGDISGSTTSPAVLGDDVVNSVDISIIITDLDKDDVTGNDIRSNLNQDPVINSVDLSVMLKNLDKEGDN